MYAKVLTSGTGTYTLFESVTGYSTVLLKAFIGFSNATTSGLLYFLNTTTNVMQMACASNTNNAAPFFNFSPHGIPGSVPGAWYVEQTGGGTTTVWALATTQTG